MDASSLRRWPLLLGASAIFAGGGCTHGFSPQPDPPPIAHPPPPGSSGGVDVGSAGPGGPPPLSAKDVFLTTVGPPLVAQCSSCHADPASGAPVFMGQTPEATYATLYLYRGMIAAPENSLLLQGVPHSAPLLEGADLMNTTAWLEQEVMERGLIPGSVTPTLALALAELGPCMSLADWTANGLDTLASAKTDTTGACSMCHDTSTAGVLLSSADSKATFEANRTGAAVNRWVRGMVDQNGAFLGLTPADVWTSVGAAPCDPKSFVCHPTFVLPPELATGIAAFATTSIDRWQNQQCGP